MFDGSDRRRVHGPHGQRSGAFYAIIGGVVASFSCISWVTLSMPASVLIFQPNWQPGRHGVTTMGLALLLHLEDG